ncbi:MAG TPA: NnrU family protein, partial [Bradyrhizobium sp.]|nr:NnrU family protein [Bradyrhizobium sp.]
MLREGINQSGRNIVGLLVMILGLVLFLGIHVLSSLRDLRG